MKMMIAATPKALDMMLKMIAGIRNWSLPVYSNTEKIKAGIPIKNAPRKILIIDHINKNNFKLHIVFEIYSFFFVIILILNIEKN